MAISINVPEEYLPSALMNLNVIFICCSSSFQFLLDVCLIFVSYKKPTFACFRCHKLDRRWRKFAPVIYIGCIRFAYIIVPIINICMCIVTLLETEFSYVE